MLISKELDPSPLASCNSYLRGSWLHLTEESDQRTAETNEYFTRSNALYAKGLDYLAQARLSCAKATSALNDCDSFSVQAATAFDTDEALQMPDKIRSPLDFSVDSREPALHDSGYQSPTKSKARKISRSPVKNLAHRSVSKKNKSPGNKRNTAKSFGHKLTLIAAKNGKFDFLPRSY